MSHETQLRLIATVSWFTTGVSHAGRFNKLPGAVRIREAIKRVHKFRALREYLIQEA
jgi:hypothetical protein